MIVPGHNNSPSGGPWELKPLGATSPGIIAAGHGNFQSGVSWELELLRLLFLGTKIPRLVVPGGESSQALADLVCMRACRHACILCRLCT